MREILFRGKRVDNGEWWYGLPLRTLNENGEDVLNIQCWERDEEGVTGIYEPVIPETVGQCTGLTDKNDKKVFTGDIVKVFGKNYRCIFDEYNFEYEFDSPKESISMACVYNKDVEIIGNVYDNPELLKGGGNK